jgi:hypothetical protein
MQSKTLEAKMMTMMLMRIKTRWMKRSLKSRRRSRMKKTKRKITRLRTWLS